MTSSQRAIIIAIWFGQVVMGSLFLLVGLAKIMGGLPVAATFEAWGYPAEFRFVAGAMEIIFGIGLWIPRMARMAAFGLIGVMTGAFLTHLVNGEYARLIINAVFSLILFGIAIGRRDMGFSAVNRGSQSIAD